MVVLIIGLALVVTMLLVLSSIDGLNMYGRAQVIFWRVGEPSVDSDRNSNHLDNLPPFFPPALHSFVWRLKRLLERMKLNRRI